MKESPQQKQQDSMPTKQSIHETFTDHALSEPRLLRMKILRSKAIVT